MGFSPLGAYGQSIGKHDINATKRDMDYKSCTESRKYSHTQRNKRMVLCFYGPVGQKLQFGTWHLVLRRQGRFITVLSFLNKNKV